MKRLTFTLVFGAVMVMNARASFSVTCDPAINPSGLACGGSEPRDYVYAVTWNEAATLNLFQVGWLGAPISDAIVYDDLGQSKPFNLLVTTTPAEDLGLYEVHGTINTVPSPTILVLRWENLSLTYNQGRTVYFAYNSIKPELTAGWVASGTDSLASPVVSSDIFSAPVGDGVGPLHIPIPEPSGVVLVALSAGVLVLRRRHSQ